jgi:hypothetical protein
MLEAVFFYSGGVTQALNANYKGWGDLCLYLYVMLVGRGIVELRQICWGDCDSSNRLWTRLGQKANRNMDQLLLVMHGMPTPYDIMSYSQVIYGPISLFSMSQTLADQTRDDGEISFHWELNTCVPLGLDLVVKTVLNAKTVTPTFSWRWILLSLSYRINESALNRRP